CGPKDTRANAGGPPGLGLSRNLGRGQRDKKKNEGGYRMEHFRWGTPPKRKNKNKDKNKRYGGFMVSEKSHTPLMTLFRNAIVKNAHEKGQ
uniref:Opiodes neuropeptide domain-containing protein n=1 Tax=Vombatus ursinus TaxID=29139 RepID=A0A4X2JSQ9_VOMUR